jgi:hypothetical protein
MMDYNKIAQAKNHFHHLLKKGLFSTFKTALKF